MTAREQWNHVSNNYNNWDALSEEEKIEWAQNQLRQGLARELAPISWSDRKASPSRAVKAAVTLLQRRGYLVIEPQTTTDNDHHA